MCSVKKGVLRNFAKFTGKHLCQSLFIKKETLVQVFSCEFCEISKNTFFTEHVWVTGSLLFQVLLQVHALKSNDIVLIGDLPSRYLPAQN